MQTHTAGQEAASAFHARLKAMGMDVRTVHAVYWEHWQKGWMRIRVDLKGRRGAARFMDPDHILFDLKIPTGMTMDDALAGDTLRLAVDALEKEASENWAFLIIAHEAMAETPETTAADLPGLKIVSAHGWGGDMNYLTVRWTGILDNLAEGTRTVEIRVKEATKERIHAALAHHATGQRTLRKRVEGCRDDPFRAFQIEKPLLNAVRALSDDAPGTLREMIGAGQSGSRRGNKQRPQIAVGGIDHVTDVLQGAIRSKFQIAAGVAWAKGCLTVRGLMIPEAVKQAGVGRQVTDIVAHPWLEGLTVTAVRSANDTVTISTSGSLVNLAEALAA